MKTRTDQFFLHKIFFLLLITTFLLPAQTFIVQPPKGYSPGKVLPALKLFYSPTDSVVLEWNKTMSSSASLKLGTSSGIYTLAAMPVSGKRKAFIPNAAPLSLSTGRYYGLITNSSQNTLSAIQNNAASNSSIDYSNEIQFIVESATAPNPTAPRGNITNSTPTFQWGSIPGVPAYWIIVSTTPFLVRTDSLGNVSVQGANIVWDYVTTTNSAVYGSISPASPFTQSAIPLIPGEDYYYTILNLYDPDNVAYASNVFGGIVSFVYQATTSIQAPVLTAPANNALISGTNTIRFQWDPVANANGYTVFLFNRVTQFAGSNQQIDVPIWNGNTTNNLIDFPARTNLLRGKYAWFVLPNSSTGSGNASVTRTFDYQVPMAKFRIEAKSELDNTNLLNYDIVINSTTGGYSPFTPYIVSNSTSLSDSIPVDIYQITGRKTGFYDSTVTVSFTAGAVNNITLILKPLPSTVSGSVKDQANTSIGAATVTFTNNLNGSVKSVASSNAGSFSINLPKGSYSVAAAKAGYISASPINVNVDTGQVIISNALRLTADNASVSGKVLNDENAAVQLATVKATKGNTVQQTTTDGQGNYTFTVTSGQWTIEVSKTGFVSPSARTLSLATGDNLQNQNFTIVPRANQVTGFVYRSVVSGTGQTSTVPVQGATVNATPTTGSVVTTTTGSNGQYSLSLKNGSFTIKAELAGYTVNNPTQLTLTVAQTISGVDFTLNPNPSSVSGVISEPGGALIGGATISAQNSGSAVSLGTGTYSLSLPAGTHTLTVNKTGYVTPQSVTINLGAGQALNGINFQMSANAGVISGSVVSLGQPLAAAVITATNGAIVTSVNSDNNGNYTLSVQPGRWVKSASKSGFITSASDTITIGPGQVSSNNNFNLIQNTAVISGTVNSGGQPLGSANVVVRRTSSPDIQSSTVTNINGGYSMTVEAGHAYTVVVSKTGYATITSDRGNLTAASTTVANFSLTALPASISGKVLNNLQQVLAGTSVRLINAATRATVDSLITNFNGEYTLGAPAGNYKILVSKPGHRRDSLATSLSLGQSLTNINFSIAENFAIITGIINSSTGETVSDAVLNLNSAAGGTTVLSGATGSYTAQRLIGSTYSIAITKAGFKDTTITGYSLSDGQSAILNITLLKLTGKISGTVTQSGGGAVEGATVTVTSAAGQSFNAITSAAGAYEVSGLNTGTYTVKAVKTGFRSAAVNSITLTTSALTAVSDISDLLPNNLVISGVIKDASNNNILNADISVSGNAGSGAAVTNTSGNYSVTGLAPGNYTVTAGKTGYVTKSRNVDITANSTVNLNLDLGSSKISGKILSQTGSPLGFTVTVKAASSQNLYQASTGTDGSFQFTDVSPGFEYLLFTEIFREGYTNDSLTVNLPVGTDSVSNANITVFVANAKISGNAGTSNASLLLMNNSTGEEVNTTSSSTGNYSFSFIPAGTYKLTPAKQGFVFTPASRTLTINLNDNLTADFTASANTGTLVATLIDSLTKAPVEAATVTIVSADTANVYSLETNSLGETRFTDIPAKQYTVAASKSGFTVIPASALITLGNGATISVRFSVLTNNSNVSGKISANNNGTITSLPDATVSLRITESGRLYTATTDVNGDYVIRSISPGSAELTAFKSGYVSDTATFTLSQGQSLGNKNLTLDKSSAIASGFVLKGNSGLSGLTVTANGTNSFTTTTNASGGYSFGNLPVSANAADTTIYLISVSGSGITGQSKVLKLLPASIGQSVKIDTFKLPAGMISVNVTDGSTPLDNTDITFTRPNGTTSRYITTANGKFVTESTLPAGRYKLSIVKPGYLIPDESVLVIDLPTDNSSVTRDVRLKYSYTPVTEVAADQAFSITVNVIGSTSGLEGKIFYKTASATGFTTLNMTAGTGKLTGSIPAQFSLAEVTYYMTVKELSGNVVYSSAEYKVTPTAAGILSVIKLNPSLGEVVLRKDEIYDIQLILRDGANNSLMSKFTGTAPQGSVKWEPSVSTAFNISYPVSNDSTQIKLKPLVNGTNKLTISSAYAGVTLKQSFDITVTSAPLKSLSISGANKLSNNSAGIQFGLSATDTSSKTLYLGSNLKWTIIPELAGTISSSGFFKPADSTFIGNVEVRAQDASSNISAKFDVGVYADISPASNITLTDKQGMKFTLSPNSVQAPIKLILAKQQFGPGKKNFNPVGQDNSYVASDVQYYFTYEADIALRGDSLLLNAKLEAPYDKSLALFEGPRVLGFYNFENNGWDIISAATIGADGISLNSFRRLGQYAVLTMNEPLGLKYVSILPSPFSPEVAPVKIAYFLNSNQPPANVTIRIFNLRGELVRTLLENDLQYPGKYGSRTGIKEITWDGITDDGLMARNGRYVVQVTAKDATGEVSELKQVVLVK